ncbi:MAG: restriction endonuclease [Clostridiales bacterium]|jgi:hypothetical protein|nr:restriction endonuclease [Clostridiales bacterium]
MPVKEVRTLGWIQNSASTNSLKDVVKLFVYDSSVNKFLREIQIPRLITAENGRDKFIGLLSDEQKMVIPYKDLKGKGKPSGGTRKDSPCSGIIQAAIKGQGAKEYTDDWSSDCFLRWAISLGFLEYDRESDCCYISDFGKKFAATPDNSAQEKDLLGLAYLSYPPAVRVLSLLNQYTHMTKFEIGGKLGIMGEAGFTSVPQNLFLQGLHDAVSQTERTKISQNVEGDSDKYARMICGWLANIGWVKREPKTVSERLGNTEYNGIINSAFTITLEGRTRLKQVYGSSSTKKVPKIVLWEMLATKPSDKIYLRNRRAYIIKCLNSASKSIDDVQKFLEANGFNENQTAILDDIHSLENIGLSVKNENGQYKITDTIIKLDIPAFEKKSEKSDISVIKDRIRERLQNLNHKYLCLIDLSFDGAANRDFEIQTIDLLTNELCFKGARLGESRRPDGIIHHDRNGLIIDNKAYAKGYSLPMGQQDEMARYIEENKTRDSALNPNRWWLGFPDNVMLFNFLFVSSVFTDGVNAKLLQLSRRTSTNGAAINSQNLLLLAEEIKSCRLSYKDCFELFNKNNEVCVVN